MNGSLAVAHVSYFDTSWYRDIVGFAHQTPWLHEAAKLYTVGGFVILAVLLLAGGLIVRHRGGRAAAAALAAPVGVVAAYVVNEVIKVSVQEVRPCDTLHVTRTVLPCDPPTDFSFPSNHTAVAMALAIALLLMHRKLGWAAIPFALLMAFSRVYVGAHYPHDVIVGAVVGAVVAAIVGALAMAYLAGPVERMRSGRLAWLLGPGPQAPSAGTRHRSGATTSER